LSGDVLIETECVSVCHAVKANTGAECPTQVPAVLRQYVSHPSGLLKWPTVAEMSIRSPDTVLGLAKMHRARSGTDPTKTVPLPPFKAAIVATQSSPDFTFTISHIQISVLADLIKLLY
jgi:hypothetical protein